MSYGIFTRDATKYLMHSDVNNSIFYKNSGVFQYTAAIPAVSDFITSLAITTPLETFKWNRDYGGYYREGFWTSGTGSATGEIYYQPTVENFYCFPNMTFVHSVGALENTETGYGFKSVGPTSMAVSSKRKIYYLHPNSAGSTIRSATATSIPSTPPPNWVEAVTYFDQPTGPNIIFDQPHTNPPLIFIQSSTGPIAMNFMNRDVNGKYVSASIVASSSFTDPGYPIGASFWGSNTYSFTYFIVSDDLPVYGDSAIYGIKVWGEGGDTIFDSSYYVAPLQTLLIQTPYYNLDADWYSRQYNNTTFNIPPTHGICINNFQAITGRMTYWSISFAGNYFGPHALAGRYIHLHSQSETITTVTVAGGGTCTWWHRMGGALSSLDFTRQNTPTMNILYTRTVL